MARDLNRVMLIGRVGKDPEIRHTGNGAPVATFSLATSETWKDKATGEKKESTEWHRLVFWNRLAEVCADYVHKGDMLYVEGKLSTREWEDKDGNKRTTTEIVCHDLKMLGGNKQGSNQGCDRRQERPAQNQGSNDRYYPPTPPEDIPF